MRIAVIGLGTTGSMVLWHLSQRPDVEAVGFEQFGLNHGYGSYTGESRLFRSAYHEGPKYVPLLRRAHALWSELGALSGRELMHPIGALTVAVQDDESFQRLIRSVEASGLEHGLLTTEQLRRRYPQMDIVDGEQGLLDPLGGALRPELGVLSALEQAVHHGAQCRAHQRIREIAEDTRGVTVRTETHGERFDAVVVTAGSWVRQLDERVADLVVARRLLLTWFLPRDATQFTPDRLPGFIRDRDGFHVFGVPMLDGYSVKVSGGDRWGDLESTPERDDLRVDAAAVSAFGQRVAELFPGLLPEPTRSSLHHDGFTSDKTPILDRSASGRVIIGAGFSGHGFKLAPATGELLAQLAVDDDAELNHPDFAIAAHRSVSRTASVPG